MEVFTVPGQVAHDGIRKAVLSRADGVIFVTDSQRNQAENNAASFDNLITNTGRVGLDLQTSYRWSCNLTSVIFQTVSMRKKSKMIDAEIGLSISDDGIGIKSDILILLVRVRGLRMPRYEVTYYEN
jgi:hypothetical protein